MENLVDLWHQMNEMNNKVAKLESRIAMNEEELKGAEKDALSAGLAEAIRYGQGMGKLLDDAMQLAKDGSAKKRFNELKGRWRNLNDSMELELLRRIRE